MTATCHPTSHAHFPLTPNHVLDRDAAVRFLSSRIDYERALAVPYGDRGFKLDRMRELLRRLGNPERGMPLVHVAGTKGKGSTVDDDRRRS